MSCLPGKVRAEEPSLKLDLGTNCFNMTFEQPPVIELRRYLAITSELSDHDHWQWKGHVVVLKGKFKKYDWFDQTIAYLSTFYLKREIIFGNILPPPVFIIMWKITLKFSTKSSCLMICYSVKIDSVIYW